eukprot:m.97454 g.97454  ORF g.97454 m.97454 type:complete len:169 (+) comp13595_c0_seq6:1705-2211(+)
MRLSVLRHMDIELQYVRFTVAVTEWRTKFRRNMNTRDNAVRQKATDSLLNAETVKLYCGEQFEVDSFRDKVLDFQVHEWYSISTLSLLNTGQSLIITSGLAAGVSVIVYFFFIFWPSPSFLVASCGLYGVSGRINIGRLCAFYYVSSSAIRSPELVWYLLSNDPSSSC